MTRRILSPLLPVSATALILGMSSVAFAAAPTKSKSAKTETSAPELSPADLAELKRQIKDEVSAELRAEQIAADQARAQAEADEAAQRVAAQRAEAEARARAEAEAKAKADQEAAKAQPEKQTEENPLAPPGQAERIGKHPIANANNTYKPGKGMHIESADGAFALATRLRAQFRYSVDGATAVNEEGIEERDVEHLYQLRRARVQFAGHAFNKHNRFKAELAFSPRDLSMDDDRVPHRSPLLTWYAEFDYLRDLTVRTGQYKIPYSRQRVISSGNLQLVDRSITQGEFNHDRDIGIDIRSKDLFGLGGKLRYYAGVYMGEGRDFGDKNGVKDFGLHYIGRVEVLPFGKFKDYSEGDMTRSFTPGLSLGAAYAFHDNTTGLKGVQGKSPADGGTTDYQSMTADYMFKYKGFSSSGEFHWRKGARTAGENMLTDEVTGKEAAAPVTAARNGVGYFVQAGYMLPQKPVEIAARYSAIRGTGSGDNGALTEEVGATSLGFKDAVGGGLSYYFAGHPWKLQGDYFYSWETQAAEPGEPEVRDGSHGVRLQMQLAF